MATIQGLKFGHVFIKENCIFLKSNLSFAFVNIKPVVKGHVLVASKKCTERFNEMHEDEVQDMFLTVQKVSNAIQKIYDANSMTIALQDGPEAGQTVKHVHVHILPRRAGDFKQNDEIYTELEKHDKDLATLLANNDVSSQLRTEEDMAEEATNLRSLFLE